MFTDKVTCVIMAYCSLKQETRIIEEEFYTMVKLEREKQELATHTDTIGKVKQINEYYTKIINQHKKVADYLWTSIVRIAS